MSRLRRWAHVGVTYYHCGLLMEWETFLGRYVCANAKCNYTV